MTRISPEASSRGLPGSVALEKPDECQLLGAQFPPLARLLKGAGDEVDPEHRLQTGAVCGATLGTVF